MLRTADKRLTVRHKYTGRKRAFVAPIVQPRCFIHFFRRPTSVKLIQNEIEILSIHIPKTGGSSFQKTLQSLYGEKAFQRLDFTVREVNGSPRMIATNRTSQQLLDDISGHRKLPETVRVVHGHFRYEHFTRFFQLNPDTRVVTWLRDPIRRIVSSFNYLNAEFEREIEHTAYSRQLFKRLRRSLVGFAREPWLTGIYSNYLRGRDLETYDFVGLIEHYDDELNRFGDIVGVRDIPSFNVNQAKRTAPALKEQQEAALIALNQDNLAIYNKALSIKAAFARKY
jgi:hypothetical protein